jgi:WD40 repeat protein
VLGDFGLTQGHMVENLVISPDGRWAASDTGGRNDEALYVWELTTGELRWWMSIQGHAQFAFHPNARDLLVMNREEVRLRALWTGQSRTPGKFEGVNDSVTQLRASADGRRVLAGHSRVFDLSSRKLIARIEGFEETYFPSYLSPRGNIVVSSKRDNSLWCHDLRTGRSTRIDDVGEQPFGIAMTADESLLVSRGFAHTRAYRLDGDAPVPVFAEGGDPIFPNAIAIGGSRLAVSRDAESVDIVRLPDFTVEQSFEIPRVHALAFHPDGERLVVARYGDIVNYYDAACLEMWSLSSGRPIDLPNGRGHRAGVMSLSTAPGLLCSTGTDNSVRLWSVPEGGEAESFAVDTGRAAHVDIDANVTRILVVDSSDFGGNALTFDAKRLVPDGAFQDRGVAAAMSPDGRFVAQLLARGMQIVGDDVTVVELDFPEGHPAFALVWSFDSRRVLVRGRHALAIYEGKRKIAAHASEAAIYAAVLLHGDAYAWVDANGLHVNTRTQAGTFFDARRHHAVLAPSHDGSALAVTDGVTIRCFDLPSLAEREPIAWHHTPRFRVLSLCFSHDDRQLFAGTSLGPILCFDVL